jgi:hypothetical protein
LAANLVDDFRKKGEHVGRRCLQPVACFWVSGLGFDLEYTLNVPIIDINWYEISQQKERRANEYKQRLFSILEIPVLAKD